MFPGQPCAADLGTGPGKKSGLQRTFCTGVRWVASRKGSVERLRDQLQVEKRVAWTEMEVSELKIVDWTVPNDLIVLQEV